MRRFFIACYQSNFLLNNESTVQECDARKDAHSTCCRHPKNYTLFIPQPHFRNAGNALPQVGTSCLPPSISV